MWILVVLVIGMVGGLVAAKPVIRYLKSIPPARDISWNVFSPWDALRLYMNFGLAVGILMTLPVILYHIWAFVKPGLGKQSRRLRLFIFRMHSCFF